jgi:hypothetical protein
MVQSPIGSRACGLVLPETFEAIGREGRIAGRILNVFMPQIGLERPGVVTVVGELVAAGVPQHVRVRFDT